LLHAATTAIKVASTATVKKDTLMAVGGIAGSGGDFTAGDVSSCEKGNFFLIKQFLSCGLQGVDPLTVQTAQ